MAIKSVDASSFRSIAQIDQVQDEISVLSGLKHPNIIRLLVGASGNVVACQGCHMHMQAAARWNKPSRGQTSSNGMCQSEEASPEGSPSPATMKPLAALQDMHFTNNIFYFVMEFASGGTLVDYVRKQVGGHTSLLPCCSGQPCKSWLPDGLSLRKRSGFFCKLKVGTGALTHGCCAFVQKMGCLNRG